MTLLDLTPRASVADALTGLPVAIIGAGPVGLAAAAHLAERGIAFEVLEAGERVGAAIRRWGHTRLFSPWRYLIDPAARRLLEADGWEEPSLGRVPNGADLVGRYLEPLSRTAALDGRIRVGVTVTAVARRGMDRTRSAGRDTTPFVLRVRESDGQVREIVARAVIDASGTYTSPNPLSSTGLTPLGSGAGDRIVHALPDVSGVDRALFAGRHTTVVGAGHSAANTLLALADLAADDPETRVTWLIRNAAAARVTSSEDDDLAYRAALGSKLDRLVAQGRVQKVDSFEISAVDACEAGVRLTGTRHGEAATHVSDVVVNATGFRPDLDMLREIRLDLDDVVEAPRRLAPLIDPNLHSCGTVEPHGFGELTHPEKGFFIVGMKSYGRAPTFLLATGYEQVRSIAAWLDGDMRAATAVQLDLPATGVCSTDIGGGTCCS
ncbi:FAD-dependent oxidoreductase [Microbacterium xanthum]|uniref:FAD-dependent oxidoreductase n=1 Tax=Microbacterium xanthum TaxID=3079794 RepID=UPI002AD2694C|nr:FAD-dependent oxidoreductase [Microbacterium sp. KSW-48]MDZ8170827.1 NAD(P)-binding domain-containing protein [Microbacterium sp. KSW-48]